MFSEKGGSVSFSYSVLTPEWEVRRFSFFPFLRYSSFMWGRGWCSGSGSAVLSCIGAWQSDDHCFLALRRWAIHDSPMIHAWRSDDGWCMTVRRWLAWRQLHRWQFIGASLASSVSVECMLVWRSDVIGLPASTVLELTPFPCNVFTGLTVVTLDVIEYYIAIWDHMTVLLWVNCMHDLYVSTWRLSGTLHDDLFHLRS